MRPSRQDADDTRRFGAADITMADSCFAHAGENFFPYPDQYDAVRLSCCNGLNFDDAVAPQAAVEGRAEQFPKTERRADWRR
jgi:hypothetical protein